MRTLEKLVASLRRLPGIGPKQAERLALHLLRASSSEVETLQQALRDARERVRPCPSCHDFTDQPLCRICSDPARDERLVCVVEDPSDVSAVERSRGFRGRYHVLHGVLSPLDGVGPEGLRIKELLDRVRAWGPAGGEVILATNHDTEGDATALYLGRLLQPLGARVTRIAIGVPLGGDLAYIDEQTLNQALAGRRAL
ncbi:MAG: recombination mediator RecR [Elusimicrobia bacterium]|nr:recombination mediator RecR [Elusimicrobiota bacterium]